MTSSSSSSSSNNSKLNNNHSTAANDVAISMNHSNNFTVQSNKKLSNGFHEQRSLHYQSPHISLYTRLYILSRHFQAHFLMIVTRIMDLIPDVIDWTMRILGPLLVIFAWLIFACFAYVYFNCFTAIDKSFKPWHSIYTYMGLFILFNIYYNHIRAIFTSPGSAPKHSYIPDNISDIIEAERTEIKQRGGFTTYCKNCIQPKPPRTHHCHICRNCILKMDHVILTKHYYEHRLLLKSTQTNFWFTHSCDATYFH
jgi:hypothetical protein